MAGNLLPIAEGIAKMQQPVKKIIGIAASIAGASLPGGSFCRDGIFNLPRKINGMTEEFRADCLALFLLLCCECMSCECMAQTCHS